MGKILGRIWGDKDLGGKGEKGSQQAKGGKDLREGGKDLNRERGEQVLGRKREKIWKGIREKGGKDLNRERGQRVREQKGEDLSAGRP